MSKGKAEKKSGACFVCVVNPALRLPNVLQVHSAHTSMTDRTECGHASQLEHTTQRCISGYACKHAWEF